MDILWAIQPPATTFITANLENSCFGALSSEGGNGWISIKLHQSELNICQPPLVCPNRCECGSQYCHGLGAATLGPFFFDIFILTVLTCEKVKILWDIEKNNAYQLFVPFCSTDFLIFFGIPEKKKQWNKQRLDLRRSPVMESCLPPRRLLSH